MIESIFNAAYGVWNALIGIAVTLFTTSPTAANGGVYTTTRTLYDSISDIAFPIAAVFFLIAILHDVVATPPDQQARKFLGSALKYTIMLCILANLWTIMGYVMNTADGITDALSAAHGTTYQLTMSNALQSAINEAGTKPDVVIHFTSFGDDLKEFIEAWWDYVLVNIIFLISALATFVVVIASSISIISSAFQRIIKPLAILPFASIAVAVGAGSGEANRVMANYLKTFFGYCISGAFMVICVKLGVAISNSGLIVFNVGALSLVEKVLYLCVQNAVTPIVVAGLIKASDSMVGRFF